MLRFSGAGVTDVGPVRDNNEDSAFVGPYLAIVADGVGGASAGEIASATAAHAVAGEALRNPTGDPSELLHRAVTLAQGLLLELSAEQPDRGDMATTLTAVATDGQGLVLAHIGDSRAYLIHDGRLVQFSTDHTYVQQLIDSGHLDAARARQHPWKHVVVRALPRCGMDAGVDLIDVQVEAGDRILLCSDGLSDVIADVDIAVSLNVDDPQSAAAVLVEQALAAGGRDNVTCVVLDVIDGPRVVADGMYLGAAGDPANVIGRPALREPGNADGTRRTMR